MRHPKLSAIYVMQGGAHAGLWVQRLDIARITNDRAEDLREALAYEVEAAGLKPAITGGQRFKAADPDTWAKLQLLVLTGTAFQYDLTTWDN